MYLQNPPIIDDLSSLPLGASSGDKKDGSINHWSWTCGFTLGLADCITAIVTFEISLFLVSHFLGWSGDLPNDGIEVAWIAIGAYLITKGRYTDRIPFWQDARNLVCSVLCVFACEIGLALIHGDGISRAPVLLALVLFPAPAIAANHTAKYGLARAGLRTIRILAVGNHAKMADIESTLRSDPSLGYNVVGRVDPADFISGITGPWLRALLEHHRADCLFIGSDEREATYGQLIECALQERIAFTVITHPCPAAAIFASKATYFFSHDAMLLSFRNRLSEPIPRIAKSAMDILIASVLLIVTAPLFLLISLANILDGGPILFRQLRIGAGGRPFYCLKFRTMVVDADRVLHAAFAKNPALAAEWEERRKLANDPRVTWTGRFLRKTSLDELPQLINVLRREMSLVGPRPIVEDEIRLYGKNIAQYYATRPGLTGLWQVSGRSNTSYARRVQLDVWYVNNWALWHDIAVLLKTIRVVFGREGAF